MKTQVQYKCSIDLLPAVVENRCLEKKTLNIDLQLSLTTCSGINRHGVCLGVGEVNIMMETVQ